MKNGLIEHANGSKSWWLNDQRHRENGPAIEYADGRKEWWLNGKLHREDGPAIEYADGSKSWYLNGIRLTEEEFNKEIQKLKPIKPVKLIDRFEAIALGLL